MALNPQNLLVDRYWQEGFIDGIEVLSDEEVKIHRAHLENAERALGHSLHYMSRVHTVLRSPFELATHPALVDLVEKIIGPDILLHNVTYIIKEPHTFYLFTFIYGN